MGIPAQGPAEFPSGGPFNGSHEMSDLLKYDPEKSDFSGFFEKQKIKNLLNKSKYKIFAFFTL